MNAAAAACSWLAGWLAVLCRAWRAGADSRCVWTSRQRKLANRSDRVKAVDYHPTEPWLLVALYNGNVHIWNHETQALVKSFEATDLPVRAAKFVARKSWIVTGSDDMQVRVFNYNTHEKVITFDAHSDYIRSIAVHNTQPYILTASDDCLIKLWDWDKGWKNVMTFEGHTYFVMHVAFNPKDGNTFASASMDRTIKVWSLGSRVANYTLEGHQKGVNCVDYYTGGDKPYLLSGGDDKLIKVWDYQNKACVQTLEGHTHHVTVVCFHPELPIIVSGSEDGTIRIWHANTYRPENTLNYGMERVWALAFIKGSNDLAFGYDEGTICIKLGRDEPAISMDNSGKVIWARHSEIQTSNVKASGDDAAVQDGERVMLPTKDLGSCEIYPQTLQHSPNGRFVVVCGDGEYIIYTALAWRNKSFGQALEFVWAMDSNEYAIRESASRIRLFKAFKEKSNVNIRLSYSAEGIFGGALLGIRSSTFLIFYDWETGMPVRRVDVVTRSIFWSESDLVAIASDDSFYVLRFNRAAWQAYVESGATPTEEGFEAAFEFVTEIAESVKTGYWVGDCFIYTNAANRLNYLVGGQVSTVSHFDTTMYLLGYLAKDNRIYICDKNLAVTSYALPLSLIEYQTAILRGDMETAMRILPTVPAEQRNKVARFLEGRGLKEEALAVSTDLEHRFELAVQLSRLDLAYEIAKTSNHEHKWKTIGDVALTSWQYGLAEECLRRARDLEGLLLIYQTSGNAAGLEELSKMAAEAGSNNIAFVCHFLLGRTEQCVELLIQTARIPEAALFARTYVPSQIPRVLAAWKASLEKLGKKKAAEALADPSKYANLFPDMEYGLFAEAGFKRRLVERGLPPAANYTDLKDSLDWDIVGQIKERFPNGIPADALHQQQTSPMSSAPPSAANGHSARQHATPSASDSASISPASAAPFIPITQLAPPAPIDKNVSQSLLDDDRPDLISDNMSHLSLEVNTTGTGSLRGDIDFDDLASFGGDGMSGGASVAGGGDGPLDDDEIDKLLS
ncbi:coatomer WD associated region-domain-containing protein [Entophlyctis helioformis]|nr:coatomer WD associated region-domain-containing protein [Entophlyctis helioformis]